jgi:hypothetical protein
MESSAVRTRAGIVGRNKISRKGHHGYFSLHLGNARKPLIKVAPDAAHPGMFRVVLPNGHFSDMVNLTWAMDAAVAIALATLNKIWGQERLTEAPPNARNGAGIPRAPKTSNHLSCGDCDA